MCAEINRPDYVMLRQIDDGEMRLCELRTTGIVSREHEMWEGRFTDYRMKRTYPDFIFKFPLPRNCTAEYVHRFLSAYLEGRKLTFLSSGI